MKILFILEASENYIQEAALKKEGCLVKLLLTLNIVNVTESWQ